MRTDTAALVHPTEQAASPTPPPMILEQTPPPAVKRRPAPAPAPNPLDENLLRALADSMPQIVWSARPDGFVDYFNARWYEFTGLPAGSGGDEGWKPILHPDDLQPCLESWYRAVRSGEPYELEYRLRDGRRGNYRWHLGRALPAKDAHGRVTRWFGTCTDIHEHKEQAMAFQKADRRKNEFLAMLAHELRNPLASICSALALLRTADTAEREWATDVLDRQSGQLNLLIDDLLDVARIASGKIVLRQEPVDLAEVLDRAVETVRPAVTEQQHALEVDYAPRQFYVKGDASRLEQMVVNVLGNAAKYTPPQGHLSLRASQVDGHVVVVATDDGLGIAPEKLPHIFELYAQAEATGSRPRAGLGLGLTIVQKLAELHGGTVSATSPGLGLGSEFTIRLPACPAAPVSSPPAATSVPNASPAHARILIVDDHQDSAHALARLLRRRGYQVEVAHDGFQAFAAARSFSPAVILLDLDLPQIDGCQVAARLRHDASHRHCLLIALTGFGQEEDRKRCQEAGFDRHFIKPVELSVLHQFIADFLAQPALPSPG